MFLAGSINSHWICHFRLNLSFSTYFSYSSEFVIQDWICHLGLILLFWAEFVILDWSSHFRLIGHASPCYICHYGLNLWSWAGFAILGWFPEFLTGLKAHFVILASFGYSKLIWLFLNVFIIQRRLWYFGLNLGWICDAGLNLSFYTGFICVKFVNTGCICHLWQIC